MEALPPSMLWRFFHHPCCTVSTSQSQLSQLGPRNAGPRVPRPSRSVAGGGVTLRGRLRYIYNTCVYKHTYA
eukprot:2813995-Karenia_brevis.AAC.1